jgi:uncharacterized protein involved in exopolysaccharide biosynthesis
MILKFVETFFRYKWLILLPPILIPLIVGPIAVMNAPAYYETGAGIWVDRAGSNVGLPGSDGFNQYISPAQNQINRISDLLRTRAFVLDVASRTPYAEIVKTPAGEEAFRQMFFHGFSMFPSGERVLSIRFRGANPQLTVQIVNSFIDTFKDKLTSDRVAQAEVATGFYEGRLKTAQDTLDKANEALRRYIAANPRLTTIDPDRGPAASGAARLGLPASAIDPTMSDLLRQQELAQKDVEGLKAALENARLDAAASIQGNEVGFQLVDAAQVPTKPTRERRKALIFPAAGFVVGAGLSAALLVLLVASDRTVRTENDLAQIARVAGVVPRLRLKDGAKRGGLEATRRAIGFSAGALLPSPSGAK